MDRACGTLESNKKGIVVFMNVVASHSPTPSFRPASLGSPDHRKVPDVESPTNPTDSLRLTQEGPHQHELRLLSSAELIGLEATESKTAVLSSNLLESLEQQGISAAASQTGPTGLALIQLSEGGKVSEEQEREILSLFDNWNDALQTLDSQTVTDLYAQDAILLPTVSGKVRHNHEEIKDYFDHFLQLEPKGTIDEHNVRLFGDVAVNSGIYTFDLNSGDSVQARYTYVYRKTEGEWKIVEHHSSKMPDPSGKAEPVIPWSQPSLFDLDDFPAPSVPEVLEGQLPLFELDQFLLK